MGCCGLATRIETAKVNGRSLEPPSELQNGAGLTKNRVCRDIVFLILFIACCFAGAVYLIIVNSKGDIDRLFRGYDSYGNVCGQDNPKYFELEQSGQNMEKKPFYLLPPPLSLPRGECVENCKTSDSTIPVQELGYFCIKTGINGLNNPLETLSKGIVQDVAESWKQIIIIGVIGFVFSVVFVLLLRFLAPVIIWLTIGIIVVGSVGGTIALWVFWDRKKKEVEKAEAENLPFETRLVLSQNEKYLLTGAIVATAITLIILILLIAMRKRIKLVVQLFIEAGKAIADMPLILLQPFFTLLSLVLAAVIYGVGFFLITTAGDPRKIQDKFVDFELDEVLWNLRWFHIFMALWVSQFILACQDIVIAGATATWFFSRNKSKLGSPILTSVKNLLRYHLGSVALGSLIIAIIQMIRMVLKWVEQKTKNTTGALNWLFKCCQCFLWCFETFMKFLSRNAYIEIAIHGHGFCKSAQKAFQLLASNALRVAAINFIGDFVLFLMKIAVVLITFFIGLKIMETNTNVSSALPGTIIGTLIAALFVSCFIAVYEMVLDSLFICFCEDCQMNNGLDKPFFMSRGLMQFVENSKKVLEADKARKKMAGDDKWAAAPIPVIHQPSATAGDSVHLRPPLSPNNEMKTGMTPLHPGYKPVSEPASPARLPARLPSPGKTPQTYHPSLPGDSEE